MNSNLILDEFDEKRLDLNMINCIYLLWMRNEIILRDILPISCDTPIRNLLLFTIHLKDSSKSLYSLGLDHLHRRTRKYYLMQKYTKKWITLYINKKEPVNNTDLELDEIDSKKYYINHIDYKERKHYLFSERDFCKLIKTCLENSYDYDIEPSPMSIKNPYTNKEFSKTELRSFNTKVNDMPILWSMFVDSDYDIVKFKYKYYNYLLELCIPNYVEKLGEEDMIDYIIDIFQHYNTIYCSKCLLSRKYLKDKKVKNAITGWIRYLKLNKYFESRHINDLDMLYGRFICSCTGSINVFNINPINSEDFTSGIDFTKSLFNVGYKGKTDKSDYWMKKKIIERKKRILNKL